MLKSGFTLAEIMIVLLIIGILCVATIPVSVRMFKREEFAPLHGSFECYYDTNGSLKEVLRDENGDVLSNKTISDKNYCEFSPNAHSLFFLINAISGGSGGQGTELSFKSAIPSKGADYIDSYIQHKDYIFGVGSTVSFAQYNNSDWNWVYQKLNANGVPILALLTSLGGNTDGSIQIAYNHRDREGCTSANTPWNSYDCTGDSCCYTYEYKRGIDGANGGRYIFYDMNVIQGSKISANTDIEESAGATKGILFMVDKAKVLSGGSYIEKRIGCVLQNGEDGCYYYPDSSRYPYCSPKSNTPHNYTGYQCTDILTVKGSKTAGGTAQTAAPQYRWFDYSLGCQFTDCQLNGNPQPGVSSCSMEFCRVAYKPPLQEVQLYGGAVNASRKVKNGVNFYAQAGNAGNYRTMYVSKFKHKVIVKPGAGGTAATAGGDTIIKYDGETDANAIMNVSGAKPSDTTNSIVVGRHFQMGNSKITYEDNDSKSKTSYSDYFSSKTGGFVYPTMASSFSIPTSVGNSGRGGYTIFRTTGPSDLFTVKYYGNTYRSTETSTSTDLSLYTCTESGQTLEGTSKFCVGDTGKGGAVVITW